MFQSYSKIKFVLFIDGITNDNKEYLMGDVDVVSGVRKVFVSSWAITLRSQDTVGWNTFEMMSWTLSQYEDDCSDKEFFTMVKKNLSDDEETGEEKTEEGETETEEGETEVEGETEMEETGEEGETEVEETKARSELIANKFFVAGSCARWFFGTDTKIVTKEVDDSIKSIHDVEKFVKKMTGSKANNSVNHLISHFGETDALVSEYAVRVLTIKCELAFVNSP